jgi:hypothetical protein
MIYDKNLHFQLILRRWKLWFVGGMLLAVCFFAGRGLRAYARAETSLRHSDEV